MAQLWRAYEARAVGAMGAGPRQRREERRVFYAGAWAMLNLLISTPDEEEAQIVLDQLQDELETFAEQVRHGLA
jgi:hypothetical protein